MAITVYEKVTSRAATLNLFKGSELVYEWFAIATAGEDEIAVINAVSLQFTANYAGFDLLTISEITAKPKGGRYWEGTAKYGLPAGDTQKEPKGDESAGDSKDQPQPTDTNPLNNSFAFEVSAGSQHLTQSTNTITTSVAPGFAIPNTHGAIGVDKNKVAGVDIVEGKFEFTYTVVFSSLTWGYLKNLRYMVGSVNIKTFLGFSAGELLLIGASGSFKAGSGPQADNINPLGSWEVAFKFWAQYNQTGIVVGNIPAFNKDGWDYVWFGYSEQYDATAKITLQIPIYASVERVYPRLNFKRLGFNDKALVTQN